MSGPLDFPDPGDGPSGPERGPGAPPRPAPARPAPPPLPPPGASRYGWFVAVAAVLLLAVFTLDRVRSDGTGAGPERGQELVPFAVPLAAAPPRPDGAEDANLDPARVCRGVRGPGILNLCVLAARGPLVLALFPSEAAPCRRVLEQFARVRARLPGVQLVAVGSAGERGLLTARRWPFPVGWDRDRAVSGAYGLAGCPQLSFARRGGAVEATTRRTLDDADLVRRARALTRPPA